MKSWTYIIAIIIILALAAMGYGWHLYNKSPADVRKQQAFLEIRAADLLAAFKQDEIIANSKYVDKVLIVSGKVTGIQIDASGKCTLFLEAEDPFSSVVCSFYSEETASVKNVVAGSIVRVKGKCTGILMDVILNKCSMIE